MTFRATWERGMAFAREATWGTSPSYLPHNEITGKYFSALTTSAPGSLERNQVHIRPVGQVGKRSAHQYGPTPGTRRGGGSLDIPFASDTGGLLLVMALGSVSSALTADAGNPLKAAAAIGASPATIGSITDPTTSAFLKFTIADATGGAGTIAIIGVTADGETVSESIAVSGNGDVYSRRSYTTLTSVIVTHTLTGTPTIAINGYTKATHTITAANTQPSLTIVELGDPAAGSGNAWFHKGMLVSSLGMAFDASSEDGLFVVTPTFDGKYPAAATAPTLQQPVHVPFPAWTAAITVDGGSYARLLSFNATLTTNARAQRAANGTQDPQGPFYGTRMLEGELTIAVEDDSEYSDFINRIVQDVQITFTTPFKLDATLYHALTLDMDQVYFAEHRSGDADGVATVTLPFYVREDATTNILKATLINSVASYA